LVAVPGHKVMAAAGDITTYVGSPGVGSAAGSGMWPRAVTATPGGVLYVADNAAQVVRAVDLGAASETVVAGNGLAGFSGDGGRATAARLNTPNGVASDAAGNVYIADYSNHRVRRVDPGGTVVTVAGTGSPGFGGDGGPATAALLNGPMSLALDAAGNLYIADTYNQRIRKVDTSGIITTVAGSGSRGFGGDGGAATAAQLKDPGAVAVDASGTLYIADTNNYRVRRVVGATISTYAGSGVRAYGGDGGAATAALLGTGYGLAVDAGGLYIAEPDNHRIRRVSAGIITTFAGNGIAGFGGDGGLAASASLNQPTGVTADGAGNVYVADTANSRLRRVSGGIISTVAGNGSPGFGGDGAGAASAQLSFPAGVAFDSAGNLFIADSFNHRVRRVSGAGVITTYVGTGVAGYGGDAGPAAAAQLNYPEGVATDLSGNLFIADAGNNRIRKVDTAGTITTVAGTGLPGFGGDGGQALAAQLFSPWRVALDGTGNLYIADLENDRVRRVDAAGTITTVAGTGSLGFSGDGGPAVAAQLDTPYGLAVDGSGNLLIADSNNQRVRMVDGSGAIRTIAGGGSGGFGDGGPAIAATLFDPTGLAVDASGNLYISESLDQRVRKVDVSGTIFTVAGGGSPADGLGDGAAATNALLMYPDTVATDGAGNLYIADSVSNRIRRVQGPVAGVVGTPPSAARAKAGRDSTFGPARSPRHSRGHHERRKESAPDKTPPAGRRPPMAATGFTSISAIDPTVRVNQPGLAAADEGRMQAVPDTTGAIGPNNYLEMVNSLVGVYDRSGTLLSSRDLFLFTGVAAATDAFDPQIQWDGQANRWFYTADLGLGRLALGWSKTADPTNLDTGWCRFAIHTGAMFHDFPKLGHYDDFVLISTNVFSGYWLATAGVWAVRKPAAGDSTCPPDLSTTTFGSPERPLLNADGTHAGTPVASNTIGSSAAGYVVAAHFTDLFPQHLVMSWHVVTQGDGGPALVADGDMPVDPFDMPSFAPQPGVPYVIDTWDTRLNQSVANADPDAGGAAAVWAQHTVNGTGGRSVVRWYELVPASVTVRQQGTVESPTDWVFNGAISPSIAGNDAALFYNRGGPSQLVLLGARSRTSSTPLGQLGGAELVLGTSSTTDRATAFGPCLAPSPCRWGDYAGASPDPTLAGVVWGSNQLTGDFAEGLAQWVTRNFAVHT
jgi:sugar lactone lactonase YvrE